MMKGAVAQEAWAFAIAERRSRRLRLLPLSQSTPLLL